MAKQHYKDAPSPKEEKAFAPYLSEDEALILATGYGKTFLRQKFIVQLMLPGIVFWIAGFVWAYMTKAVLPGNGLLIGMGVSAIWSLFQTLWIHHSHRYLLTTRRVIVKKGLMNVKIISALYDKITHIEVEQGFLDRIFLHYGTVKIHTAGSDRDELVLQYIEAPVEFKNMLERLINREREQSSGGGSAPLEGEVVDD